MTYRIAIADSDVAFEGDADRSVLDAALQAGIQLPYSCRKGVCGNCAGSIAEGTVTAPGGAALVNEACAPGQILYCVGHPTSDLVLRPTRWRVVDPAEVRSMTVRVFRNDRVAPDVSLLRLRLPAGRRARFRAGQYLQVRLADGSSRCYSMANPPQQSDALVLHVRHLPDGRFSGNVACLVRGDLLTVELPLGNVALEADDDRPIVFVAGGTGFAPIHALLEDMVARGVSRPVTLIWGTREATGLYLPAAIARWQKRLAGFRFIAALSGLRSTTAATAAARTPAAPGADRTPVAPEAVRAPAVPAGTLVFAGRANRALVEHFPRLAGHVVYCCGSPALVASVRFAASSAGLAVDDFHADTFVPGPAPDPAVNAAR